MISEKKFPKSLDMSLDEALARYLQTDLKEIEDEFEKTKREEEETKQYVEKCRESIRKGARQAPKRFSL